MNCKAKSLDESSGRHWEGRSRFVFSPLILCGYRYLNKRGASKCFQFTCWRRLLVRWCFQREPSQGSGLDLGKAKVVNAGTKFITRDIAQ